MTTPAIEWDRINDGFFRSADSRFDLMYVPYRGQWLAIDGDLGRVFHGTRAEVVAWCARQREGTR